MNKALMGCENKVIFGAFSACLSDALTALELSVGCFSEALDFGEDFFGGIGKDSIYLE